MALHSQVGSDPGSCVPDTAILPSERETNQGLVSGNFSSRYEAEVYITDSYHDMTLVTWLLQRELGNLIII